MNFEQALAGAKQGHAARRAGWDGHVRIEGIRMVRVQPNRLPFEYQATLQDKAATDWECTGNAPRARQ